MANVAIVTGSAGLVGAETARFYLEKGYRVVGMVRRSSTVTFGRIEHIQDDIEIIQGDFTTRVHWSR